MMFVYNQLSLCVTRTTVLNNDKLLGRPPPPLSIIYFRYCRETVSPSFLGRDTNIDYFSLYSEDQNYSLFLTIRYL